ncbi:tRNA dimethylallyltransferase, putative [Entamoeba histolytica HM-1:IMSS-B]|uniref:tRNA isopentenyltransferase, putative n=4 Tax=Entamoeba histolytica TaxID=5759 RepID=C4LWB5_ENTH1|nr:tRNA isopentenyltransferase, putative [Entamoeba histolytica HM-1:IMSS]EAL50391.1 tRNA isopentenyltransferase, putative [Entamoeba histolytica HM-1:IMSS]EMH73790.1 tRNA dimethylallyltransferase, putative [Entamoeba histolytica HM-1:IMSS-B]ENY63244.1 tRNA isopentenyltransferase, putative [Entamoeba histolytica HM-1:IMSS-A]GAT92994.1 tRNA isopentenyltransferase putative [Entamoeba histolytica]|eukprot:XP_655777.1 tRNA isopentenyltransferase, putative [Entamoeba histolytica HM-1:IMSS]
MNEPIIKNDKKQIIVVIGATASGKSTVAHQICKKLNGEIINADVMQCYKGIPIATNKPSEEEKQEFHYHLVDFVSSEVNYTVQQWVNDADKAIETICLENKIPIICGGTSYYIDALLFRHQPKDLIKVNESKILPWKEDEWYNKLKEIDPIMAERLHPNDITRIKNALIYYIQYNQPISSTFLKEHIEMKYNPIIIWVDADIKLLYQRADKRVNIMVQQGMVEQNMKFIEEHEEELKQLEWKWGICMAIGFQEFIECKLKGTPIEIAIENVKIHTKQYIKKQIRWINNKIIKTKKSSIIHFIHHENDILQLDLIFQKINEQLNSNCNSFNTMTKEKEIKEEEKTKLIQWKKYYCEICGIILNGEKEWNIHLISKRHKYKLKRIKKTQEYIK